MSSTAFGRPTKDQAYNNLNVQQTLGECNNTRIKARCIITQDEEVAGTSIINNLIVNNLTIEDTITIPPPSIVTLSLAADTQTQTPVDNAGDATFNWNNSAQVPFTASTVSGTNLSAAGAEVVVGVDGAYSINYRIVFATFSGATRLPLGARGAPATAGSVAVTVLAGVSVNNVTTDLTVAYAPGAFNFQTVEQPFINESTTLDLLAGDRVSLYTYSVENSDGAGPPAPTLAVGELTVTSV